MIKVGTLRDYQKVKRLCQQYANEHSMALTEKKTYLVRHLFIGSVEALSIVKLRGTAWAFRYNEEIFKED